VVVLMEPMASRSGSSDPNAALAAHYQRHRDSVYRWCMHFGGGRSAWAQDVTQDVFVRLFENLPKLTEHDDLGGWLYRVTANLCRTRLQRERSWLTRISGRFQAEQPEAAGHDHELKSDAMAALAVVRSLPPRERVAFCMKLLDGKTQREIARVLGVSEALVCRWLSRAWKRVEAAGWEVEDD
jgi:RNA polymerase sigma factor (sigma-70 family)